MCFLFNDEATTEIYTLSLHDALPIFCDAEERSYLKDIHKLIGQKLPAIEHPFKGNSLEIKQPPNRPKSVKDRKSTRLNSSHANISYAVFCLKIKTAHITVTLLLLIHI